jgi:hypothetical protein
MEDNQHDRVDLETWLTERKLEIKPAERAFIRERAMVYAAEEIAKKLVHEIWPIEAVEKKLQEELKERLDEFYIRIDHLLEGD